MSNKSFWHNLQIALKAYGGILPYIQLIQTDSGQPIPWPTVDPTQIVGRYITEAQQLDMPGITAVVLEELQDRIKSGMSHDHPVPLYRMLHKRFVRQIL